MQLMAAGCRWGCTPFPRRTGLRFVVGEPIPIPTHLHNGCTDKVSLTLDSGTSQPVLTRAAKAPMTCDAHTAQEMSRPAFVLCMRLPTFAAWAIAHASL